MFFLMHYAHRCGPKQILLDFGESQMLWILCIDTITPTGKAVVWWGWGEVLLTFLVLFGKQTVRSRSELF